MLTALSKIIEGVSSAQTLNDAMKCMVSQIKQALSADCCSIYLSETSQSGSVFRLAASDGLAESAVGKVCLGEKEGLVGLAGSRLEVINVAVARDHPGFKYLPEAGEDSYTSFLGVPIMHQRKVLGVLVIQQKEARKFNDEEESFAVTLAAQLAAEIIQAEMKSELTPGARSGVFRGAPVSDGVAMARAWVWRPHIELSQVALKKADDPEMQLELFRQVILQVQMELDSVLVRFEGGSVRDTGDIFDMYESLLNDPAFSNAIEDEIMKNGWTASSAVRITAEQIIAKYEGMTDAYMRERTLDVRDVAQRILSGLSHSEVDEFDVTEPVIVVAEEITASILAEIARDKLMGVVCLNGAANSHAAILARTLGVPAVTGVKLSLSKVADRLMIVDGSKGEVFTDPEPAVVAEYREIIEHERHISETAECESSGASVTRDGVRVPVSLNVGLTGAVSHSDKSLIDSVGLYRTEISFIVRNSFPSEDEQTEAYRRLLESYAPLTVTMRTLDAGGDKQLSYYPQKEINPALGLRGVRLTLEHPALFLTQLKAMLRASVGLGNLRIMIPMPCSVREISESRRLLDQAYDEVRASLPPEERESFARPPFGIMIEVPSVIYILEETSQYTDFWSVGSNDLTQYLLAVDRGNPSVSGLYDPYHPAVLKVLRYIAETASRLGKPLDICGELAGEPVGALLLLASGYRSLSMNESSIAKIKYLIRRADTSELAKMLSSVDLTDPDMIRKTFGEYAERIMKDSAEEK